MFSIGKLETYFGYVGNVSTQKLVGHIGYAGNV